MRKAIILFFIFIVSENFRAQTFLAAKYGITDLKSATDLNPISNGLDSIEYRLLDSGRNGSLGLDVITALDDGGRNFLDLGFYYSSTTLSGNSGFRYEFVYTLNNQELISNQSIVFKYGNMKIGYGRNWSKRDNLKIIGVGGLDFEYGESTIINESFNLTVDNGELVVSDIFVRNSLLFGLYSRLTLMVKIKGNYGFIVTPGGKLSLKFEDDFENDKTEVSAPRASFEFSAGVYREF